MKNDNLSTMEGDIVNEETSIYDTARQSAEKSEPKKQLALPKIGTTTLKRFIPRFKILVALFIITITTCVGLLVVSKRNLNQDQPKADIIVQSPKPTVKSDPKIVELTKKVEQFKKDVDESAVTKRLTPPSLDLTLKF